MGKGQSWLRPIRRSDTSLPCCFFPLQLVLLGLLVVLAAMPTSLASVVCPSACQCHSPVDGSGSQTASCAYGGLTSLPPDLPASLTSLGLQWNEIVELGNLSALSQLQFLNLSHNSLSSVRAPSLDTMFNLRVLDLSFNTIEAIEDHAFGSLAAIDTVNLAINRLMTLDGDVLFGLRNLRVLNLSGNFISELSNHTFFYLHRLEILDLSYNTLEYLPNDAFRGLESVKSILLHHNNLFSVTGVFDGLRQLNTLDLSYNSLETLENSTFINLPQLSLLQLSFNNITEISPTFCGNVSFIRTLKFQGNSLQQLDGRIFQNFVALQILDLSQMPYLQSVSYDAFDGAYSLTLLNLSSNPQLSFLHPQLMESLPQLAVLDLRFNNLAALSHVTFHSNERLTHLFVAHNPLQCGCGLAWVGRDATVVADLDEVKCELQTNGTAVPISQVSQEMIKCNNVTLVNVTDTVFAKIGSQLVLGCDYEADETGVLTWITPRGLTFHYHPFHPDATSHLIDVTEAENLTSEFHREHNWHDGQRGYDSDLQHSADHIVLQSDGSLYIDFVLRNDAGPYQCIIHNAQHNASATITLLLDYQILFDVKIMSLVAGLGCAASVFTLNAVYVIIMWAARKLINKRRRERIHKLLESLDEYRTNQISRIRTNYSYQLGRIRDHYHTQSIRLKDNYTTQMKRVRRGCSNQVERIRDNYHTRLTHLKEYSSHQIQQIRDATNNQIIKIRDYGSLQMERLREGCKLQQQHVLKVIEAMNLENCRTVVETECLRTESMIFDINFPDLEDDNTSTEEASSQHSQNESVYITALNSDDSSEESLATVVESQYNNELTMDAMTIEVLPSDLPTDAISPEQELPQDSGLYSPDYVDCEGETDNFRSNDNMKETIV